MSKETLLGYVILFIGVVVGWALCWLWGSVRERRGKWSKLAKEKINLLINRITNLSKVIQRKEAVIQFLQMRLRGMEREK